MRVATRDRGAIVHFAGFHRLSPALDGSSRPAFSAGPGDGLARCGWESFFRALRANGLALEYDPEDAPSARFVAASAARRQRDRPRSLPQALDHARRFFRALTAPSR
jgi:hypothetical protein